MSIWCWFLWLLHLLAMSAFPTSFLYFTTSVCTLSDILDSSSNLDSSKMSQDAFKSHILVTIDTRINITYLVFLWIQCIVYCYELGGANLRPTYYCRAGKYPGRKLNLWEGENLGYWMAARWVVEKWDNRTAGACKIVTGLYSFIYWKSKIKNERKCIYSSEVTTSTQVSVVPVKLWS